MPAKQAVARPFPSATTFRRFEAPAAPVPEHPIPTAAPLFHERSQSRVDASAWLALVSLNDGRHAQTEHAFVQLRTRKLPLLTTNLVLAEVQRLLLFRAGTHAARRFLALVSSAPLLTLCFPGDREHVRALAWLGRCTDQPISYTDAVSFAVMESSRCRAVLSYDRHFDLAGFPRWPHAWSDGFDALAACWPCAA